MKPRHARPAPSSAIEAGSGTALPGVVVVLADSAGKRLAGVLVGDDGRYAIRAMAPGRYAVRAERIGYRADAPTAVTLAAGQTPATINMRNVL